MTFKIYTTIFLLGCVSTLFAKETSSSLLTIANEELSRDNIFINTLDTIPNAKVEVNGKLKINNLPIGTGAEIFADSEGNLFKKNIPVVPPYGSTDSLTYTITAGPGIPLNSGTFDLLSYDGGTFAGSQDPFVTYIAKDQDVNSVGFYQAIVNPTTSIYDNLIIEIKFYKQGETTPYLAHKLKKITCEINAKQHVNGASINYESIVIHSKIFGIHDYLLNKSFAYDKTTSMEIPY